MVMQLNYNTDEKLSDMDDKSEGSMSDVASDAASDIESVDDSDGESLAASDVDDDLDDEVEKDDIQEVNLDDVVDDAAETEEQDDDEDEDNDNDDDEADDDRIFQSTSIGTANAANAKNTNSGNVLDLDDDLYDSDEDFDNYEKFQSNTSREITQQHYPELISHNYEEIDKLSKVIRDKSGTIVDPFHRTLPFLSRYERARVIGERAKQLENGAMSFVELEPHEIDSYMIAMKEFQNKKIPFIIKRPLPNGASEYWKLSDLEVL